MLVLMDDATEPVPPTHDMSVTLIGTTSRRAGS